MKPLEALLKAYERYGDDKHLLAYGKKLMDMVTSHGFPEELMLEEFLRRESGMPLLEKVFVLSEYRVNLLEHMRQNTFTDSKLKKFREKSIELIDSVLVTNSKESDIV